MRSRCRVSSWASMRASVSIVSESCVICALLSAIVSMNSRWRSVSGPGAPSRSSSAAPRMRASGVRTSWEKSWGRSMRCLTAPRRYSLSARSRTRRRRSTIVSAHSAAQTAPRAPVTQTSACTRSVCIGRGPGVRAGPRAPGATADRSPLDRRALSATGRAFGHDLWCLPGRRPPADPRSTGPRGLFAGAQWRKQPSAMAWFSGVVDESRRVRESWSSPAPLGLRGAVNPSHARPVLLVGAAGWSALRP